MNANNCFHVSLLALLSFVLAFATPVFGYGDPLIAQAGDLLHEALNPGGDPPSIQDKTKMVQQALELLRQSAAVYRGQRAKAIQYAREALEELKNGDPDNKADEAIRQAYSFTRDIT